MSTNHSTTEFRPGLIDRATLPLGRAEALTGMVEDFIESLADNIEDSTRGDALVHALQLELAEIRAVLETATDAEATELAGQMQQNQETNHGQN